MPFPTFISNLPSFLYIDNGDTQIQQLLVAMKLDQYKEAFASECIDGGILQELGEDLLQEELGVASRLHRLRLLRVINGVQSAEELLRGLS